MRALRFAAVLLATVLAQLAGVRLIEDFPRAVDLLLVLVVFNGLRGDLAAGLFGGLAAGLVSDALTGGLYGLHGFADTIVGYGTAYAAQRLVIQRPSSVMLMFALAAVSQQAVLTGLVLLLQPEAQLPVLPWVLIKVGTVGLLGWVLFSIGRWSRRRFLSWRRSRTARLR